jgi:type IV pilus assembly protein PilB
MKEKVLGQILVRRNIITEAELETALGRHKAQKGKYLGQILFEMGVPQEEINKALDSFAIRKRIGEILIELKVITIQQLEEALEKQSDLRKKGVRKPLASLLVELGYLNESGYLMALSKFFNMPIVSLEEYLPTPALQKAVGEKYAQKNMVVVLENNASIIKLALAEPTFYIMEELKKSLPMGKRIEFYVANPSEIQTHLKKLDPFNRMR